MACAHWKTEQLGENLIEVAPTWEAHERGADCWCEPAIQRAFMARVVIHVSRTCKDEKPHKFVWGMCAECGERQARYELDQVAPWLADMYRKKGGKA